MRGLSLTLGKRWLHLGLAFMLGGVAFAGALEFMLVDGFVFGVLAAEVHTDTTTYAPGYTHPAFRKVRTGLSQDEVVALLGQPLEIGSNARSVWGDDQPGTFTVWRYSKSNGNYRTRVVLFAENGRVYSTRTGFYLD